MFRFVSFRLHSFRFRFDLFRFRFVFVNFISFRFVSFSYGTLFRFDFICCFVFQRGFWNTYTIPRPCRNPSHMIICVFSALFRFVSFRLHSFRFRFDLFCFRVVVVTFISFRFVSLSYSTWFRFVFERILFIPLTESARSQGRASASEET